MGIGKGKGKRAEKEVVAYKEEDDESGRSRCGFGSGRVGEFKEDLGVKEGDSARKRKAEGEERGKRRRKGKC